MIEILKAEQAINSGLVAICAWCEHYWNATDQRPVNHSGCVMGKCGGPLMRKAFPLYKGPWKIKTKYCFICGKESTASVDINNQGMIGICEEHIPKLKELLKTGKPVVIKEKTSLIL